LSIRGGTISSSEGTERREERGDEEIEDDISAASVSVPALEGKGVDVGQLWREADTENRKR
jgi:hypothetical protein